MKIKLKKKYLSESGEVSYLVFSLEEELKFKEWQFMMLEKELHGTITKRAYSIVSTYLEFKSSGEITFFVKRASEKGMSDYLTKLIQPGDELDMMWPFGHMTNDYSKDNYLFLAMWSGRASNIPLLRNILLEKKNYNKVYSVFGERYFSNIVMELKSMYDIDIENYQWVIYFSKENIDKKWEKNGNLIYHKWYIQKEIDKALEFIDSKEIKVFMCGKPVMVDEVVEILMKKGINRENILFEKY